MSSLGGLGGQFWSTLIGAVGGGIIAGAAGLGEQIFGVRAARKERLAAKEQQDLATAFSVMVKVVKIVS